MEKSKISFDELRKAVGNEQIIAIWTSKSGEARSIEDRTIFGAIINGMTDVKSIQNLPAGDLKNWSVSMVASRIGIIKRSLVYAYRSLNPKQYARIVKELSESKPKQESLDFAAQVKSVPESEAKVLLQELNELVAAANKKIFDLNKAGVKIRPRAREGRIELDWANPPASKIA